jgi:uncharacterized protein YecE (DUF72 family)
MGQVRVGAASWTDRSLLVSGWYPPEASTPDKRLRYYARQFSLAEVDATYCALPAEQTAAAWATRTPAAPFTFNVKAFSLFTGHPPASPRCPLTCAPPRRRLARTGCTSKTWSPGWPIRPGSGSWPRRRRRARPASWARSCCSSRRGSPSPADYILARVQRTAPARVCVEFRNHTWMTEDNQQESLGFLADCRLPSVCADMPRGHRGYFANAA